MVNFFKAFKSTSVIQQVTICISVIILILSLTQPAFYIDRDEDPAAWADSFYLFFLGWMFPLGGALIPFLIWCSNPIYIASIILTIKGNRLGFYLSILSTLIAFSFSQLDRIITSESGEESAITSLELGYKLWFTSFLILSIGTGVSRYYHKGKI